MPLDSTFTLVGSLLDSAGVAGDRVMAAFPYDSQRGRSGTAILPDGAPHALVLPAMTVYQLYLKNLDPVQTLSVSWTPVGSAQDLANVLAPGGFMLLWDVVGGAGGLLGVVLTASVGPLNYEFFLGA
jgi:hypothetical protein